jgi:hypothetical protein
VGHLSFLQAAHTAIGKLVISLGDAEIQSCSKRIRQAECCNEHPLVEGTIRGFVIYLKPSARLEEK